jgi:hypothetical protein
MDFQANRSDQEDRVMQRQLYRAGQNNQPAAKPPASGPFKPSSPPPAKAKSAPKSSGDKKPREEQILLMILLLGVGYYLVHGTPAQRKKALVGIGVAVWLLMLGSISYCLFLPDLDALRNERRAIWQDKSLTFEEKKEKMEQLREKEKNLTPSQRKQMWEMDRKEFSRKRNKEAFDFLKMTPEEQVAYLKKQAAEREKFFEEIRKMRAARGDSNGKGNGKGNGGNGGKGNGGPGGGGLGGWGGGPPGGGWGGGGGGNAAQAARLDSSSPESRAGGDYQRALSAKLGLGGGGRSGPGGGGGGPRGGR